MSLPPIEITILQINMLSLFYNEGFKKVKTNPKHKYVAFQAYKTRDCMQHFNAVEVLIPLKNVLNEE
ncbi:hypothetical protein COL30_00055 [Bacillus pseudomycoides]|nr:hypothetical protein COO19_07690 [Bacillus pseudomycoides]PEI94515.1 hypothetical protein CN686_15385 [Bacillus pseudomycoides]PEK13207.1 hypothetical protein CN693_24865 [Bacillus pseudomycoides]PEM75693.1 hypothetical protein CN619_09455 [Bacillus pseudomycoides]PEO15079.1 hypothetical protein CN542_18000 [Bacillus pseudomycoides]